MLEYLLFDEDFGKRSWRFAILLYFVVHLLDVATTLYGIKVLGFVERNELVSGPNGEILLLHAVLLKLLLTILIFYPMAKLAQKFSLSWFIGSLIWLWAAFLTFYGAVCHNFAYIIIEILNRAKI